MCYMYISIFTCSDFRGPAYKDSMWEHVFVPALASSKHSSLWPFCLELGPDAWEMRKCLSIGPMAWRRKQMFIPLPSYFLSIIAASNEFARQTHTRARQSGWECVMVCTYNYFTSLIFVPGGRHAISLEDEVTTTALSFLLKGKVCGWNFPILRSSGWQINGPAKWRGRRLNATGA